MVFVDCYLEGLFPIDVNAPEPGTFRELQNYVMEFYIDLDWENTFWFRFICARTPRKLQYKIRVNTVTNIV